MAVRDDRRNTGQSIHERKINPARIYLTKKVILGHERFERNHRLGTRIKRVLSLHGSAHLREQRVDEKDANPQRHQEGRQNQGDIKAAVIAFQVKMHRTFSTRPIRFVRMPT